MAKPPVLRKKTSATTCGPKTGKTTPASLVAAGRITTQSNGLKESTRLKVFEIPVNLLVEHSENPNEQSEATFDEIVDRIRRDGFDEPIIVVPEIVAGKPTGRYTIVSGHHRKKAAIACGYKSVPSIIREGWDEDRVAIELITRNNLRGNVSPFKFTELFDRLNKRYDKAQLQKMMGLTEKKAFNALYKRISDNLNPKQKRKLEEAKEKINSVDDLSSVLHQIFKEQGSELDEGFMIFKYGGKDNFYIKVDGETSAQLKSLQEKLSERNIDTKEFWKAAVDHICNGTLDRFVNVSNGPGGDSIPSPSDPKVKTKIVRQQPRKLLTEA